MKNRKRGSWITLGRAGIPIERNARRLNGAPEREGHQMWENELPAMLGYKSR